MAVITISKEYAAGGVELGQELAKTLGYRLVGKSILHKLAERLGMSESEAELLRRAQETSWIRLVDEYLLHTVKRIAQEPEAALDDAKYFQAVKQLVAEMAAEGNIVILGWGGQGILAGIPEAVHVRVVASPDKRAQRLSSARGMGLEQAKAECERYDEFSKGYVEHYLKLDWNDPHNYHLSLNLGRTDFNIAKAENAILAYL